MKTVTTAELVEQYAAKFRDELTRGNEYAYLAGIVESLSEPDPRSPWTDAERLERIHAAITAAGIVRAERYAS